MVIVQIRDGATSCTLSAELRPGGDLVVRGHDARADSVGGDAYGYVYTVRAGAVARLCALLEVEHGELIDGLQRLLAPSGVTAGAAWRTWLKAHDVPYELTVH
jgi:hypothetical protein